MNMETERVPVNVQEEEILKFWKENEIYSKVKKANAKGKKFYMMDGPPYANAHIHMGTALNKTLKDVAMRMKRLQGFDVFDRPGYDTHGLPIEFQVEKLLGTKGKQDIEKFGIGNFVKKCKEHATQYIDVMNNEFINLGVWMDWENPYLTLSDDYIEAIWHAFKEADKKKLLYLGKYPVHVCTRCETAVAYNEIEYGKQKDTSVYVKFPLKKKKNTFLVIFTTTPWTLPANTGIMANPNADYVEVELSSGERWIITKDLMPKIMATLEMGFTIKDEFKGKKMEGWEYESPLAKNLKLKTKNAYKVILSARYVTTEDGTGLVHCAPGHGKEDYEVGREYGLDAPSPVSNDGMLTEEAGKYSGKKARVVDREIIDDLKADGFLVYEQLYEHDYPLCWRDKSPLLMISQPQWFLKISEIQKKLLKENEKVNWVPEYMQLRMKAWLEGIGDWPVSRQRYWGTPLPIWVNEDGERIVVGSLEELKKLSGMKKIDLHKPGIDEIEIVVKGKKYKRVTEVLDVWFDSGVSSWAALGYPGNDKLFKKYWPADFNVEGKDQVRGWWNSQFILSEIAFGKKPFESIEVHGMILDLGKKKMSKSLGNAVSPKEVIEKYGRDYFRYYLTKSSKGEDFVYDENEFREIQKFFMLLLNTNNFVNQLGKGKQKMEVEDKWILSRFNRLVSEVSESYNGYKFYEAIAKIETFLMADLSRGYIQIIRDRSDEVSDVMNEIRLGLLKLLSPVVPFITEKIWQNLLKEGKVKEESINLAEWPKVDEKKINYELESTFVNVFAIIEAGLAERDEAKIGLKWPLAKANIYFMGKLDNSLLDIIAKQLNVKKVILNEVDTPPAFSMVKLDTKVTPELEAEGYAREFARNVQSARKKKGFKKGDLVSLIVWTDQKTKEKLHLNINFLLERTNSKKIEFADDNIVNPEAKFSIKDKEIELKFS